MPKRQPSRTTKPRRKPRRREPADRTPLRAPMARTRGTALCSYTVGALPIVNQVLDEVGLEQFLREYLPKEDGRTKLPTAKALLVLLRNVLVSREPIYGVGEWAAPQAPDLLGLAAEEIERLNDDRMGRALDRLFLADVPSLVLAVAAHVVRKFQIPLDELHNDSTTISFFGAYSRFDQERRDLGRPTLAITFGHSKDHRPDLKQLLYILTVTRDGGVPVHFRAASGNTTDDTTHRDTWELLCRLAGRRDFLYVADSKLATSENMRHIDRHGGRFVSVLPRTRAEEAAFRARLREGQVVWEPIWDKQDEEGRLLDRFSVWPEPTLTTEGFRLVCYHSTRKAELDAAARAQKIDRALRQLGQLRQKLASPRTRHRQAEKLRKTVAEILQECGAEDWIQVDIQSREEETFRQSKPGRPSKQTRYVRRVKPRLVLDYQIDVARVTEASSGDGAFLLVTNVTELSPRELLLTYKRQPTIEKRFSQLKTDFAVAPIYLKEVRRIQALLCVYFFALLVEALLERKLRKAMQCEQLESLPMYPEGRPCCWPTARRLIDLFEPVQRHMLTRSRRPAEVIVTELTRLQRKLLKLLKLSPSHYGH
jgi:transposase